MKKSLSLILVVASLASGCIRNVSDTTTDNKETPIAVTGRSLGIDTKASFEGEVSASNIITALVPASLTDGDYSTQYALGTMTFGIPNEAVGYASDVAGNKNYPANEALTVYLVGLYPSTGWASYGANAAISFTGKQDVMAAPQVSTTKTEAINGTFRNLTFEHLLTKLEINVVAENDAAARAWGTIKEIKLVKSQANPTFNNTATVNLKTGAAVFSGATTSWAVYDRNDNAITASALSIPTIPAKAGYTLVAPITATSAADADFTIGVTTTLGGVDYTKNDIIITLKDKDGNDFAGFTAGKSFVLTLTFRSKGIQASASVSPWENGGSADADID